jgi:plastocyanin
VRIRSLLAPVGLGASALLLAALVGAPAAIGGGPTVVVTEFSFSPPTSNVGQGTTVTWSFEGTRTHTSTSNQGFWDSGDHASGTFSKEMKSAGKFPYHCNFHSQMKGSVVVPLKATGSAGGGWTLRWSTSAAGAGRAFDVQSRRQGTTAWHAFKTNTTTASALFNPARGGTYQLRARTSNTAAGKESGWSPVISRRIS